MAVHFESFHLHTEARPQSVDVTDRVKEVIARSSVRNGIAVVYAQHTTCSVMIQQDSRDTTYDGTQYLMQDLLDVLESIIPTCHREGQYLYPGPAYLEHTVKNLGQSPLWSLNTDAHLRSCLLGRSESIPIVDGELQLGEFGRIYFVDFDGVRARECVVQVQVLGECPVQVRRTWEWKEAIVARRKPVPLIRRVDCVRLYVPDLEAGLAFYTQQLGHELIWRTAHAAGLRLPESETEIVLQNEDPGQEVDFAVDSAGAAVARFAAAGGTTIVPPFDIQIGRCAVVEDPWGNRLVLLDMSKGALVTDAEGHVLANAPPERKAEA
jgi:secondary thiamine-phosphate synthase enzyme